MDAAHILPWAGYDLDVVSNGLCFCKHHHWAFDEGLILLSAGAGPTLIRMLPPVNTTDEELEACFTMLEKAMRRVAE